MEVVDEQDGSDHADTVSESISDADRSDLPQGEKSGADSNTQTGTKTESTAGVISEDDGPLTGKAALTIRILSDIWLLVMAGLVILFTVRYLIFYSKARWNSRSYDGKYFTTSIETPFVIGFISPKIFIPIHFNDDEREYILNHEWTHIKNKDGVIKLFSYFVLCLHWFNPLVWLAFILLCADIEMRVDEETTELFDVDMIKEYCLSLVRHAELDRRGSFLQNTAFSGLGFGGMETKLRIKNLLKSKKMSKVMMILSICLTFCVVFLVSSRSNGSMIEDYLERAGQREEVVEDVKETETIVSETTEGTTEPTTESTTTPSETTEPTQTTRKGRYSCYEDAYLDIIDELGGEKNGNLKFALVHIGWDEIPELVVSEFSVADNGTGLYTKEQLERMFVLTVYTFRTDRTYKVIDSALSDLGSEMFYCYEPYNENICHYQATDFGYAYGQPYTVFGRTMDAYIYNQPGEYIEYSVDTPNCVLAGYADAKTMIEYLRSGNVVTDFLPEIHTPQFAPNPSSMTPETSETDVTAYTIDTTPYTSYDPTAPSESQTIPAETGEYKPTRRYIDDISMYYGTYSYLDFKVVTIEPADTSGFIRLSFFKRGYAYMAPTDIQLMDNIAEFYYKFDYDTNVNGVIDPDETYYRKCTLELGEGYVILMIEDIPSSEYVPGLDVSPNVYFPEKLAAGEKYEYTMDDRRDLASNSESGDV